MDPVTTAAVAAIAALGVAAYKILQTTMSSTASRAGTLSGGVWTPPDPPDPGAPPVITADPRIQPSGIPLGVGLPCPSNPPPPAGWAYWTGGVTPALSVWAVQMRDAHPIGTFIQAWIDGQLVGARIEYHDIVGATGATGCFKGLNLLRRVA
jgi:hypothetical protein